MIKLTQHKFISKGNAKSNMAKDGTPCDSPDLNTGSTTKSVSEMSSSVERTGDGMIDNDSESIGPTGILN